MMRRPYVVPACLVVTLGACGGIPTPEKEAPRLVRSTTCTVGGENVAGRPVSIPTAFIRMNNDGGWCWMSSTEGHWGQLYGPWLRVTRQPRSGTVKIDVTEKDTRVAYRPDPGFIGSDSFQTISEDLNIMVDYTVTVQR